MHALTEGSLLSSRYKIISLIGRGGMGLIFKAHDRLLDEIVAIKVLRSEYVGTPEMAHQLRSEIKLARKVSHPNVCRIHEYGQDGAICYISMAFIEGTDIEMLLKAHPHGFPVEEAFNIAIQAAEGLQAIHNVGIIHRDLKTSNIVRDARGVVRLMDFGIAREPGPSGSLTATGSVTGTLEYMSPEQCRGEPLDFRSDLFSLGVVIYEICLGRVPFSGESVMATLHKLLQEPPPLEGEFAAQLPPGLVAILYRAMAKDPRQRYASAEDLGEALRHCRKGELALIGAPLMPEVIPQAAAALNAAERRRDARLDVCVDLVLRRVSLGGTVLQEERTVAIDIARHGARVLTAMGNLAVNDTLMVQEVGGDFCTRSIVRHLAVGTDQIRRLGLEFIERMAPDRMVPADVIVARPPQRAAASVPESTPEPRCQTIPPMLMARAYEERRVSSRFDISIEMRLRKVGTGNILLFDERTVTDNISHHGARVKTARTELAVGDTISVHEVGGSFHSRSRVRSVFTGHDSVRRLCLEFLDSTAPPRLVPDGVAMQRKRRTTPPPAQSARKTTSRHTPAPASVARSEGLVAAREVERRSRKRVSPGAWRRTPLPAVMPSPPTRPLPEELSRVIDQACSAGQQLLDDHRHWEAIRVLEPALDKAARSPQRGQVARLLARALAKNPKWHRRAEDLLLTVLREEPTAIETYVDLALLYKEAGLIHRARAMLQRALDLDPRHVRATVELESLDVADKPSPSHL
ncbi:MAG: protein kinase [Vicinamibacteria bacterium]|nr:protein kinase [Vicinamibacteria bacterium]